MNSDDDYIVAETTPGGYSAGIITADPDDELALADPLMDLDISSAAAQPQHEQPGPAAAAGGSPAQASPLRADSGSSSPVVTASSSAASSSSASSSPSSAASSSAAPAVELLETVTAFEIDVKQPEIGDNPSGYVQYAIVTKTSLPQYPLKEYHVLRRYNDFVWIHERLVDSYPSAFVPPLPEKEINVFNKFDAVFVAHRRRELHKFLRRTTSHPVLHASPDLQTFLTANEEQLKSAQNPKESFSFGSLWSSIGKTASNVASVVSSPDEVEPSFTEHKEYAEHMESAMNRLADAGERFVPAHLSLEAAIDSLTRELNAVATIEGSSKPYVRPGTQRLFSSFAEHLGMLAALEKTLADRVKISWEDAMRDYARQFAELQRLLNHRSKTLATLQSKQKAAQSKKDDAAKATGSKLEALRKEVEAAERAEADAKTAFDAVTAACRSEILRFEAAKEADHKAAVRALAQCHLEYHVQAADFFKKLLDVDQ